MNEKPASAITVHGDVVGRHHEHGAHHVRDHVPQQDPPIRHAEHPRRLDELSLGERLHLRANDPREAGPEDDRDGDDDALEPLADHAGEDHRDEQEREAPGQVDQSR